MTMHDYSHFNSNVVTFLYLFNIHLPYIIYVFTYSLHSHKEKKNINKTCSTTEKASNLQSQLFSNDSVYQDPTNHNYFSFNEYILNFLSL